MVNSWARFSTSDDPLHDDVVQSMPAYQFLPMVDKISAEPSSRFSHDVFHFNAVVSRYVHFLTGATSNPTYIPSRYLSVEKESATQFQSDAITPASTTTQTRDEAGFSKLLDDLAEKWADGDAQATNALLNSFIVQMGSSGLIDLTVAALQHRIGSLMLVDVLDFVERFGASELRDVSLWMFRRFASHPSAGVRYAAISGLVSLEDKIAISVLEAAEASEPVSELRREISRGIEYLKAL